MPNPMPDPMIVDGVLDTIKQEYLQAAIVYEPMHSAHEGFAVLKEEVDELWAEVCKRPSRRDPQAMKREAVQVAAMALRFLIDVCAEGG